MTNKFMFYRFFIYIIAIIILTGKAAGEDYHFWGRIASPYSGNNRVIRINYNDVIFVSVWGKGIYASSDNGSTWNPVNNGLTNLYVQDIQFDSSGNMYAGTAGGGVYFSTYGANLWSARNTGLTNLNVKALTVSPTGILFAGTFGGGIFRSTDEGASWEPSINRLSFMDINTFTIAPDSSILAGTNGWGSYRSSDNGYTWRNNSSNLLGDHLYKYIRDDVGMVYAATWGGNLFQSNNNGITWVIYDSATVYIDPHTGKKYNTTKNITGIVINKNREFVVSTSNNGVWRYDKLADGWTNTDIALYGVNDIAINSAGVIFITRQGEGIWKSTNDGQAWVYTGLKENELLGIELLAPDKKGLVFSGTSYYQNINDTLHFRTHLYRSTDNGKSWHLPNLTGRGVYGIAFDSSQNYVYAATDSGVYRSTDKGMNWSFMLLKDTAYRAIAVKSDGTVFVSGKKKTYRSNNFGVNWVEADPGLTPAMCLAISSSGDIYAGGYT
ncbi:MAG: hypothetical protein QG635_35, partial [Bacteroidota bacterium]|nr:hypothetical protein [Bacteroidota bacterium]